MTRPKIGDLVEIKTAKGFSYALYTHRHGQYGPLLRIFKTQYGERPMDFSTVVKDSVQFSCFFPLGTAVRQKLVECVANVGVPEDLRPFPTFRSGMPDFRGGKITRWWLWDGEKEWQVGELSPEQRRLSVRGIWNYTILIERIEEGYTTESDPR